MSLTTYSRIIISGELSAFRQMLHIQRQLAGLGVPALLPDAIDPTQALGLGKRREHRTRASFAHIARIRSPSTSVLLAINPDSYDEPNYISPSVFGEIAIAFAHRKGLFVLYGMPEAYRAELGDWNATALYGDIQPLTDEFRRKAVTTADQFTLPL
jgi:hypothetical protein